MKLIVKKLQGGECTVEVQPSTFISKIKQHVAKQLHIPVEQQKLLFMGRTLVDEQAVQSYKYIKDGSKLNLLVRKPLGLNDVVFKSFKKAGMSELEAKNATTKFLTVIEENLRKLSWDDIERLAMDCMDEPRKQPASGTEEMVM